MRPFYRRLTQLKHQQRSTRPTARRQRRTHQQDSQLVSPRSLRADSLRASQQAQERSRHWSRRMQRIRQGNLRACRPKRLRPCTNRGHRRASPVDIRPRWVRLWPPLANPHLSPPRSPRFSRRRGPRRRQRIPLPPLRTRRPRHRPRLLLRCPLGLSHPLLRRPSPCSPLSTPPTMPTLCWKRGRRCPWC